MAFVVLPLVLALVALGHFYREGVPVPLYEEWHVQVWDFFIQHHSRDFWDLLQENLTIWCVLYIPSHLFLYSEPSRDLVKDYKFNPKYPSPGLMLKEFVRSIRGVYICTVYESLVHRLSPSTSQIFTFLLPSAENQLELSYVIIGGIILYLWGDAHFYFTHRLLHNKWLYKNVHKYHHESYNPDPFSGLSMHWFESMVYFSAAPLLALAGVPRWLFRLMTKGLLIFPLEGHTGYGTWAVESSNNHYVHHAKFDYNYGSSPLWDHILGTAYKPKVKSTMTHDELKRQQNAMEQACLVGCEFNEEKAN